MIGTDDMLRNLGKNIRSLRKSKKMTIDQLAEKSFLSGKYLQGVEVGSRNISIKNLNRISKALDTSPEILLNMKTYELKNSDDKIFAISEKLKKSAVIIKNGNIRWDVQQYSPEFGIIKGISALEVSGNGQIDLEIELEELYASVI